LEPCWQNEQHDSVISVWLLCWCCKFNIFRFLFALWRALVFENLLLVVLADPRESETVRPLDMHHGMEVRVGVSKGAVCPSFI